VRRIFPAVNRCLSIVAALVLLATGAARAASRAPTVVMISLDGTRPADVTPELLPSLIALAERGARAEALIPSFPTNTFPNHVTLVTGVAPERHGLVDNVFVDPERGAFERQEIPTWIEVEPLWSQVERRGLLSASFYWVGSEGAWPGGASPRYWRPFSGETGEREKVDQILAWLDLPAEQRPRLITSWFHGADHPAHVHGPGTPEVAKSLRAQNVAIAALIAGLDTRAWWDSLTLLFVSDHGMVTAPHRVDAGTVLTGAGIAARVTGIGGFANVYLRRPGSEVASRAVSVLRGTGLSAWERDAAPAALRVQHRRFGDVVVTAPIGTAIVYAGLELTGFHGYAPEAPEMAAVLIAAGRGVPSGLVLPPIRNVDVAPTVLALLGLPVPAWMEGTPVEALVRPDSSSRETSAKLPPIPESPDHPDPRH
jgi:predicted AlkP superfamily pyrophosphatase or phosphodiesterase